MQFKSSGNLSKVYTVLNPPTSVYHKSTLVLPAALKPNRTSELMVHLGTERFYFFAGDHKTSEEKLKKMSSVSIKGKQPHPRLYFAQDSFTYDGGLYWCLEDEILNLVPFLFHVCTTEDLTTNPHSPDEAVTV